MKSFTTAAKDSAAEKADEEYVPIEFELTHSDGTKDDPYTVFEPTLEQVAIFSAAFATDARLGDRMPAVLDFLRATMDKPDFIRLRGRLMDRDDELQFENVTEITSWIMEQFSSFPTQQPSGSRASRRATGARSTGRAPGKGSTRSISPSPASTT